MVRKYVRLAIAVIVFLGSISLFVTDSVYYGLLVLMFSGLFVLTHFKNEKLLMAFYYLRKNNFEKAGSVLAKIKHPESMIKTQEAYFYFLTASAELQNHKNSQADKDFKKALNLGLRLDSDKAVAKLNLAGISLSRRNKKVAQHYLQEAKSLDRKKILTAQIRELDGMMKRM
jgi:Flp pilus assembly protein TadD